MLPAVLASRGGQSRDAVSPNRREGCGGRRGSRQIRAQRPRQQRRGREGEKQRPPERSPRLRRPRGARAAAAAMLEEPECGAPGARAAAGAMDCKGRAAFPVKKLIQARLPFKRLNLVPKEKDEATAGAPRSPAGAMRRPGPRLAGSLDNVENDCLASEGGLGPPLLNGEGPLGGCLRTRAKESVDHGAVVIDLTEDSCELPPSPAGHSPLQAEASAPEKAVNGVGVREQPGLPEAVPKAGLALLGDSLAEGPCAVDEGGVSSRGAGRRCDPQEGRAGWRAAGGILCRGKVPVVLLQDILAATPARSRPASESDRPEPDPAPSPSSLSASSPSSSPEGQHAPKKRRGRGSPSPGSTPVDRVSTPAGSLGLCAWTWLRGGVAGAAGLAHARPVHRVLHRAPSGSAPSCLCAGL
ncbi:chromatin assembly factor 1 subunit A-like [Lepus europaeus]|uniref:chromatin assembly factor 1 subunit A-like n=1 Tax=Lepus europaeus TaxID=9983 RepID=UPI002B46B2D1|nr:chromatin assembly factor 1 subunit A-like [Lepus europaeus]